MAKSVNCVPEIKSSATSTIVGVVISCPPKRLIVTSIPITKPSLVHDIRKLSELKVEALDAIYEQEDLAEQFRVKLKLEFATTETEVHQADIAAGELPPAHELLARLLNAQGKQLEARKHYDEAIRLMRAERNRPDAGSAVPRS